MGARAYLLINVNEDIAQADFINTLRELEEMSGIDFVDPVVGSRDLVILETDPADENRYLTPDGYREFERYEETLRVMGGEAETLEVLKRRVSST